MRASHSLPTEARQARVKALCEFVIKTWGALRSNRDATITGYANTYTGACLTDIDSINTLSELEACACCSFPLEGISSWSKWLNFVWPKWALIYDARIAFSLNSIQYLLDVDARAFPVPVGRDNLLSRVDMQSLVAIKYQQRRGCKVPELDRDAPRKSNSTLSRWLDAGVIPGASAYAHYLKVMNRARDALQADTPNALVECEMLLFYASNRNVVHDLLAKMHSNTRDMPKDLNDR